MTSKAPTPYLALFLFLTACQGTVTVDPDATDPAADDGFLAHSSFLLPSQGTPNNNGFLGPFCCTGVTAVVDTTSGFNAGYAYFYSVKGQAYNLGDTSYAPDLQILIAGLTDAHDPKSTLMKSEIDFTGSEMKVGAQRSATAGQLSFTATIEQVSTVPGQPGPYFDMQTLSVKIEVSIAP